MFKCLLTAALSAALITAPAALSNAETEAKTERKTTAQQQKMKDCASQWAEHKKAHDVKGQAEYRKFLSGCLKS
jgi:Ni/Co efflux regulator RcnB